MSMKWSMQSWFLLVVVSLVSLFVWKVYSASQSPLHVLPGPKRASLLLGNLAEADTFTVTDRNYPEQWTDTYGGVVRMHGLLGGKPEICVTDPGFLHHVFVSNYESWRKPRIITNFITVVSGGVGLIAAQADVHKRQRKMFNPMFTVANVRSLTPCMHEVAHKLSQKISKIVVSEGKRSAVIDMSKLLTDAALDIIGAGGLGYDFDALGSQSAFARAVKRFQPAIGPIGWTVPLFKPLSYLGPYWFRSWVMDTFCPFLGSFGRSVMTFRQILQEMEDTSLEIYRDRRALIAKEHASGGQTQVGKVDMLSNFVRATFMDSNMMIDESEAISQISTLIFGGHEPTSNAMTRTLDVLADRQDLQDRLRSEIVQAQIDSGINGDLPYETIMDLPLLDGIVRETLRLHPPAANVPRESNVDMVVPLSIPIKSSDGKTEISEVFVPKNTTIHAGIEGLNRSEAIWGEDAKEFKPERWQMPEGPAGLSSSSAAFAKIPAIYSSTMTFLGGPRYCVAWRMALLENKLVIAHLIQRFRFEKGSQRVKWMYAPTGFPLVDGDEKTGPQLPLIVTPVAV